MWRHPNGMRIGLVAGSVAASLCVGVAPATATLSPERRLTTNPTFQTWPEISGTKVVYSDYRRAVEVGDPNDPDILFDIRVRDVNTGKDSRITPEVTATGRAAISGNRVVWNDYGNGRTTGGIWYHNLRTGTHKRVPVAGGQELEISGSRLCYERNNRIYVYDLTTKKEKAVSPKGGSAGACGISGSVVVWQDHRNGNFDIYSYNLSTRKEKRITTDSADQGLPKVSSKYVVWFDYRNGELNADIYAYNLRTGKTVAVSKAAGTQWFPDISGSRVVWMDERHGEDNTEIYARNLSSGVTTRITRNASWSGNPVIDGGRIVYEDNRNNFGDVDLYMRTLS